MNTTLSIIEFSYVWRCLPGVFYPSASLQGISNLRPFGLYGLLVLSAINEGGIVYRDEYYRVMGFTYSRITIKQSFEYFSRKQLIKKLSTGVYSISPLGFTLLSLLDEAVASISLPELAPQAKSD